MAVVAELIREESNGTLSFGDYTLSDKTKMDGFEFGGDKYKVKTFNEITKLEKNGSFVYESVPGTAVFEFSESDKQITFYVEGTVDSQVTVGLEASKEYKAYIGNVYEGKMKTNLGGKLNLSVELSEGERVLVRLEKEDE